MTAGWPSSECLCNIYILATCMQFTRLCINALMQMLANYKTLNRLRIYLEYEYFTGTNNRKLCGKTLFYSRMAQTM